MTDVFAVKFSYKGKAAADGAASHRTTAADLLAMARSALDVDDGTVLRLIFKGKTIARDAAGGEGGDDGDRCAFPEGIKIPRNHARVVVIGSAATGIRELNSLRSDPLVRGFDDDGPSRTRGRPASASGVLSTCWGPTFGRQHEQYKFCRFQECTDASFGSRPGSSTPHAFRARELLERLASDPGIVAILTSRELRVGTLGEMDPIDDRIMQAKEREGGRVLGYNTNMGMRIDVKLRTDDLAGFRPYAELAATLIHELSHNWVGDHDAMFWTNYGQMRVEYLWTHARLTRGGVFVNGKRTASLAGVMEMIVPDGGGAARTGSSNLVPTNERTMDRICESVISELAREMAQHRLPVRLVVPAVTTFGREIVTETRDVGDLEGGHRLGMADRPGQGTGASARERALAAAERRARESKDKSR